MTSPVQGMGHHCCAATANPTIPFANAVHVSVNGGVDFVPADEGLEGQLTNVIVPHPRKRCFAYAGTGTRGAFATLNAGGTCK